MSRGAVLDPREVVPPSFPPRNNPGTPPTTSDSYRPRHGHKSASGSSSSGTAWWATGSPRPRSSAASPRPTTCSSSARSRGRRTTASGSPAGSATPRAGREALSLLPGGEYDDPRVRLVIDSVVTEIDRAARTVTVVSPPVAPSATRSAQPRRRHASTSTTSWCSPRARRRSSRRSRGAARTAASSTARSRTSRRSRPPAGPRPAASSSAAGCSGSRRRTPSCSWACRPTSSRWRRG